MSTKTVYLARVATSSLEKVSNYKQGIEIEIGSKINGCTILKTTNRSALVCRCKCGNEFTADLTHIKQRAGCGKCVQANFLRFKRTNPRINVFRFTYDQAEILQRHFDDIVKFANNPHDATINFPVLQSDERYPVLMLIGIPICISIAKVIAEERARIDEFLK